MAHWKKLFDPRFLGSWDLEKQGDVVVQISDISIEDMHNPEDTGSQDLVSRPVVAFRGAKKKWVLNSTNAKVVAKLHGTDTDKWIGKFITIYATTCMAFGQKVACIRVRNKVPSKNKEKKSVHHRPDEKIINESPTSYYEIQANK